MAKYFNKMVCNLIDWSTTLFKQAVNTLHDESWSKRTGPAEPSGSEPEHCSRRTAEMFSVGTQLILTLLLSSSGFCRDITVTSDLHMRHRCRLDDHSVMKRWFVWVNRALANKTTFYCRVLQCSKPSSTSTHLAERSAAFWRTECRRRRDTVTHFCHSDWSPPLPLLTLDSPHKQLESLTESLMWKRFEAQREPKLKEEDARREGGRWTEAARWAEPWNTENCCSQENFS